MGRVGWTNNVQQIFLTTSHGSRHENKAATSAADSNKKHACAGRVRGQLPVLRHRHHSHFLYVVCFMGSQPLEDASTVENCFFTAQRQWTGERAPTAYNPSLGRPSRVPRGVRCPRRCHPATSTVVGAESLALEGLALAKSLVHRAHLWKPQTNCVSPD